MFCVRARRPVATSISSPMTSSPFSRVEDHLPVVVASQAGPERVADPRNLRILSVSQGIGDVRRAPLRTCRAGRGARRRDEGQCGDDREQAGRAVQPTTWLACRVPRVPAAINGHQMPRRSVRPPAGGRRGPAAGCTPPRRPARRRSRRPTAACLPCGAQTRATYQQSGTATTLVGRATPSATARGGGPRRGRRPGRGPRRTGTGCRPPRACACAGVRDRRTR